MSYIKYWTNNEPTFNTKGWVEASGFHDRTRPVLWRESEFITDPMFTKQWPKDRSNKKWSFTEERPDFLEGHNENDFMYKIKYVCSIDPTNTERPHLIMTYVY